MTLAAEELLAGSSLTYVVEVPASVLRPAGGDGSGDGGGEPGVSGLTVRLRPLTVRDLQLVCRAAKESDTLLATLMVHRALVEPILEVGQVAALHVGLVQYLLHEVNRVSGIAATAEELSAAADDPLAKAAFVLAREFGWTPHEVSELTLGQVLLHLKMLRERRASDGR
ncbi:MAG: hypothetical protein HZB55_07285 [Deltaproteobacteria bacterium]|nr:hypothetical protein [Deltaproteobacteria bacterium]